MRKQGIMHSLDPFQNPFISWIFTILVSPNYVIVEWLLEILKLLTDALIVTSRKKKLPSEKSEI